jgi:hypothetical protein
MREILNFEIHEIVRTSKDVLKLVSVHQQHQLFSWELNAGFSLKWEGVKGTNREGLNSRRERNDRK